MSLLILSQFVNTDTYTCERLSDVSVRIMFLETDKPLAEHEITLIVQDNSKSVLLGTNVMGPNNLNHYIPTIEVTHDLVATVLARRELITAEAVQTAYDNLRILDLDNSSR